MRACVCVCSAAHLLLSSQVLMIPGIVDNAIEEFIRRCPCQRSVALQCLKKASGDLEEAEKLFHEEKTARRFKVRPGKKLDDDDDGGDD